MENEKASCGRGLQFEKSKNPSGASPSSPVGVQLATPLFTLFKKPSFMNNGGDGSSGTMKKHPEPSQGKLINTTPHDHRNKKILMPYQASDKGPPISGKGLVGSSTFDVPSNSDQPPRKTRSKWDRNLNNTNMDPKKLKR